MTDFVKETEEYLEHEQRGQRLFEMFLEKFRDRRGHHLALHVRMGETSSYVTSVTLDWVAEKVRFAADLPIFERKQVAKGSMAVQVDDETISAIQQRRPNWNRQLPMTIYLASRRHHKFPPLLLVGYQPWVYLKNDEKWGTNNRAMDDSLTVASLEPAGIYCDLQDRDTVFYALDGQHRLMAIQGLKELLATGSLARRDRFNKQKTDRVTLEEIISYIQKETQEEDGVIHNRLQALMQERIGIEIIPAVISGESYEEAHRRLRQIFVDVNEHAKRPTKGENVLLDEQDGFRIVARRVMAAHPFLKGKVELEQSTLRETADKYTTLQALASISEHYLGQNESLDEHSRFAEWGSEIWGKGDDYDPLRPNEEELASGVVYLTEYFNMLQTLPSHTRFSQGKSAADIRSVNGEDNILFRPIAQTALAQAFARLVTDGANLNTLVEELCSQENNGQLKLRAPTSPWFGVLSDPISGGMRRHKRAELLCARLFEYLLGGGLKEDDDRERLRMDFADARKADQTGEVAYDLAGGQVALDKVLLPQPWR